MPNLITINCYVDFLYRQKQAFIIKDIEYLTLIEDQVFNLEI